MQNRWKSKVLWAGLASAVLAFLLGVGVIDLGMSHNINVALEFVFTVLAAFGVINNPTDPNKV